MTEPEAGNGPQRPIPPRPEAPPGAARIDAPTEPAAVENHPEEEPERESSGASSKVWFLVALAVIALLLVGLVVWLLATANRESADSTPADVPTPGSVVTTTAPPPSALPLPREAAPADFRLGDCFADFAPESQKATIVACDTPHSAQFVANYTYQDGDVYPGADALRAKALEACQAVTLAPAAAQYVLNYERVYPSSTSWEVGDRRVDCFVKAPEGNVINASVLP
ncbi:septum formation family protein [Pseudarthrobacter sp. J75]|uniref:septum formation family protein n=1 Tax=unclassified Pseudarthrobacter TaxID=2647000 RepID=UPI002E808B0E|nr:MULTISPECIES: septum formation family protein [unclassified Pseudarthrobacter]MEE2522351.1 septum formation family protein [Pseudarthrobacter sp. J47]MEE2528003.1 septum formation family protein [Pseudarthrobacter sp. J75]